ncbi:MAG: Ryanodine receptor Ryr [Prevotella sp.]|nr:Ryanodine receptor Ryr [Prevotella sp.]
MVDLYVPKSNDIQTFPIATFVEAWNATGGVCTTAFPVDTKTYHPKFLDLKHVKLPNGFDELREAIAENAHDRWALERQSEGWTYGPKRDDSKLETPDMVPYAQLPESEKQYDRIMAEDTLKLLTALGYKIEKND